MRTWTQSAIQRARHLASHKPVGLVSASAIHLRRTKKGGGTATKTNNAAEIRHRHHHRSHNTRNHIAEVHFGSGSGRITLYNNPVSHKLNQFYILFMLLNIKYKMEGLSRAIQ
jgi:hypothetical protein